MPIIQSPFGNGWHDSWQYHVFSEGKYFAARVFWTETLWHHSAWVYDEGVRELLNSDEPLERGAAGYAELSGRHFQIAVPDETGTIRVEPGPADAALEIRLRARHSHEWLFPYGGPPTVHQGNLDCEVSYQGRVYRGIGYCKRYHYVERFNHWGYRFVHATPSDGAWALWSADATFGYRKYAYFKRIGRKGDFHEAKLEDSSHRDDAIYGVVGGERYEVGLEELGVWETRLRSPEMDSQMRQRFCAATIAHGGRTETGYAVNETCFGTIA